MCFLVVLVTTLGCEDDQDDQSPEKVRSIPAPIRTDYPYDLHGKPRGIYSGDIFQLEEDGRLHFIVMQGLDTPKPGQAFFKESRAEIIRLINGQDIRVRVISRESNQAERGFVYRVDAETGEERDVGAEMIELGWGWFDGNEFDQSADYQALEAIARDAKVGLWVDPAPIPPWEFEAAKSR